MSLGVVASANSVALDDAVGRSINDGVTYVVAAGNENLPACGFSPARVGNAITVGSTTRTDVRSEFSNYGGCVDIFAPGSDITSAWRTSNTALNTISGTSMASPHVAGVAALYLEKNPSASPAAVAAAIIGGATQNVVTDAGPGSPNRLLYAITNVVAEPFYEGFIDHVSCDAISGWVADRNRLNTPIHVTIYDGAIPVATVLANELRTGVGDYLRDNGMHGFAIPLPSRFKNGKPHTLRVRAEESTVDLINSPQSLTCSSQYTYYEVVARHSGKCLDVFNGSMQDGASVIQWPCTGDINQQWQVIPIGEGYIKFIARHSNKALAVESLVNGAPVMQLTVDGTAKQQWQLVDLGGGYLGFMTRQNGKALEVAGGSIVDGAQVQQWSYSGAAHQQWLVRPRN